MKVLGEGGFGKVFLVRHVVKNKYFALKVIKKAFVVQQKGVEVTINEKHILSILEFSFILGFINSFQTNGHLCLVIELAPGGDLYQMLQRDGGVMGISKMRFYMSQLVITLNYLYTIAIIHRDLKPENILIAASGNIRLADFGVAKILRNGRTGTFVGTMQYMAPEILNGKHYNYSVDWWAMGCIMYELVQGATPFYHSDEMMLQKNIKKHKLNFTSKFTDSLRDLIYRLLQPDIPKRLGCGPKGPVEIRQHKFFEGTEWKDIMEQTVSVPFIPTMPDYKSMLEDPDLVNQPEEPPTMIYQDLFKNY